MRARWTIGKGPLLFVSISLAAIWLLLPLIPAEWGLRFGLLHKLFLSGVFVSGGLFFALLNWVSQRAQRHRAMNGINSPPQWAPLGILVVYLATVGFSLAVGVLYPQFEPPRAVVKREEKPAEVEQEKLRAAIERGKELFFSMGCYACHPIEALDIRGGQRGPDLSNAAEQATVHAQRAGATSPEEYLKEHIKRGSDPNYFIVPGYAPIMPPFGARLNPEQLNDSTAFLMSLKEKKSE